MIAVIAWQMGRSSAVVVQDKFPVTAITEDMVNTVKVAAMLRSGESDKAIAYLDGVLDSQLLRIDTLQDGTHGAAMSSYDQVGIYPALKLASIYRELYPMPALQIEGVLDQHVRDTMRTTEERKQLLLKSAAEAPVDTYADFIHHYLKPPEKAVVSTN